MAREFPIWVIVILPWLGALASVLAAQPGVRVLGSRRAGMLGHYFGLGAATLALLFVVQGIDHLLAPDDPRALGHTPLARWIGPLVIGELRIESTLIADRLSTSAALVLLTVAVLARMFVPGPAGQRDLFGVRLAAAAATEDEDADDDAGDPRATISALHRLALLGLLEGAALLFVLAGDLGLAALGWALLGVGAAMVVAREVDDERRASAATRVLALGVGGDLVLGVSVIGLAVGGIGLAHNNMWAPLTGDKLYASTLMGLSLADLLTLSFVGAAFLRLASLAWAGNSLTEAVLEAVLIPIPAIYLLIRYQRALSYAPSVLATLLVFGMLLALLGAAVGLVRPLPGRAERGARPGRELGLAGTGLAWVGLIAMALGVGAWRTAVLLLLAHALGRLGLRLALLVAERGQLPHLTAHVGRVLCWGVAGIAPGLGFCALAQTLVDTLTRTSVLAPWISWIAGAVVLVVAFMLAAGVARIWYESLGRKPGGVHEERDEDGLDFGPLALLVALLAGLGVVVLGSWFGAIASPIAWLDKVLPLAGGHESAPTGIQPQFRDGLGVGRPWVAGSAALITLVTWFGWMWARERFHRALGDELAGLSTMLERVLGPPRRALAGVELILVGLTELAARGIGRGLFEAGPRVIASLARDVAAGLAPRVRALALGRTRLALLGAVLGFVLLLGWLYAKPEVASVTPSDDYGFGGLRPRLIRAGGDRSDRHDGEARPAAGPRDDAPPRPPIEVVPEVRR